MELASLDSIPDNLIDNAAVLGVLSLVTAVLFLIDLAGPRGRSTSKHSQTEKQDAEKISFGYPTLPRENKDEPKTDKTDKNSLQKPKFFPEKFKKVYKREQADKILENEENIKTIQNDTRDDVDTFIQSQSNGYHKFNDKQPDEDSSFEKMEKSKYGSVRNGNSRLFMETEPIQKIPSRQSSKQLEKYLKNTDTPTFSSKQYEEEMVKNMSYLKLLDEKHKAAKRTEDKFYEPESSKGHQIHKDYKRNISQQTGSPISVEREKQRHWETFDEESLPPFSVKEDYLPELQTPVFARIKENKQQKSYNIYDNYSNYVSSNGKKEENSQTDSLRSKTSTLKTKPPTLQQIAEYFGLEQKKWPKTEKREAASQVDKDELPVVSFLLPMSAIRETKESGDYRNEPTSPTDPGYVQYTAQNWNERLNRNYSPRTPRHSPTD